MLRQLAVIASLGLTSLASGAERYGSDADVPTGEAPILRLVTANAWGLPAPIAPARASRMSDLATWVDGLDADVVGLQELWSGAVPLTPLQVTGNGRAWDDGLALHSRHALSEVDARPFHAARSWDRMKTKGVLRARLDRDAGPPIWLFVTHLQAGHGAANARVRGAQIDELLAFVDEVTEPAIVLGDFNLDALDPEDRPLIARLAAAGLSDIATDLGQEAPTYPADGHRYDRILVRDGQAWSFVPESIEVIAFDDDPTSAAPPRFSDHLPVSATLRLVRRAR